MNRERRQNRRASGFTLIEVAISLVITGLILMTVMELFVYMLRTTMAANSTMFASSDSNKAMNHIIERAREARWLALPDDASPVFTPPPLTLCQEQSGGACQSSDFETTYGGNVDTGVEIVFPAGSTTPNPVYTACSADTTNTPCVVLGSGSGTAVPVYNRDTDGVNLYIYRANSNGSPNPSTGTCLWEAGTDNGVQVNQALMSSVAAAPNAIQFQRPATGAFQISGYEMDVKIVSGYYSPISGSTTNESTNGNIATTLTGKCVLLRDCELDSTPHAGTGSAGTHWSSN